MIVPLYLVTLWALLFVSCGPTVAQSVAVFDFELIDTSLEGAIRGARADEQERLARVSDQLRQTTQGLGPVLARRYHADRTRGAGKQPASLRWLRYALGPTHRGRTGDHRHRAEGIESDPQHEHLRSRRLNRSDHCGHERGHARQYRRDVVTHARLAGSQSASRAWLWLTAVVARRGASRRFTASSAGSIPPQFLQWLDRTTVVRGDRRALRITEGAVTHKRMGP